MGMICASVMTRTSLCTIVAMFWLLRTKHAQLFVFVLELSVYSHIARERPEHSEQSRNGPGNRPRWPAPRKHSAALWRTDGRAPLCCGTRCWRTAWQTGNAQSPSSVWRLSLRHTINNDDQFDHHYRYGGSSTTKSFSHDKYCIFIANVQCESNGICRWLLFNAYCIYLTGSMDNDKEKAVVLLQSMI